MPFNTAFSKSRVHGYPKLWFHLFRFVQFLTSAIVAGIMVFFIIHLRGHRITIPWFFFFLQSAAVTTLIWLAISTFLYCSHRLSPSTSAIANGLTGAIWIAAFGLLAWRMNNLTFRSCTTELWGDEKGVLVCKVYKFLFGAAIIAIVGNICAFVLDLRTLRRGDGMGKYTRTTAERTGIEPMRHKNLPKGIVVEETHYLRPGPNEQLYDSGSRSHSPDAFNAGRH